MDQPDETALLEHDAPADSESPLPSQRGRRGLGGLFFPSSEDTTPEDDLRVTPAEAAALTDQFHGDGSPSLSESGELLEPSADDAPTSSATSRAGDAQPLSKATLKKTVRSGIGIGSAIAHKVGARTEGQQQVGLYLADDEDQAAIGDPLAEIAHRKGGIAGGKMNQDTADFLQSMFGMANYITKQVLRLTAAREIDAGAAAPAAAQPGVTFHE